MRQSREYIIYKDIAVYLRYQYPNVLYHFDPTGLNLSKTQSGMLKAIQGGKGYPDLFIAEKGLFGRYRGLFIEVKPEGTRLVKLNGEWTTPHIKEQAEMIEQLKLRGYYAAFGIGFDACKRIIDEYLR